ncbi:hypothetical protein DPE44_17605 [Salmonella enterica subsp. salamae]|uniref:L-asparaginase n=1 Tax=Salmonella enterica subsp. salamae TaxID=59202 RepID=A0A5Y3MZ76_SALER|nr:hypothetical protein [Salmonella enterica subsp. salamae]EAO9707045.1 hypothetical protein [Salmonella enterica]ECC9706245.1 hypothetical protein [Salmonella enterica subsp. salamae]ECI4011870.1 hypothetical protein [Salmonella enterica subsp. salamae]ECI4703088.1 hypothetical protein [Salmonella enterica subsp. salamae]
MAWLACYFGTGTCSPTSRTAWPLKQGYKAILFAILVPGCARNAHVLRVRSAFCAHAGTKLAAPIYAFYPLFRVQ